MNNNILSSNTYKKRREKRERRERGERREILWSAYL
jgi:hypothetical protein